MGGTGRHDRVATRVRRRRGRPRMRWVGVVAAVALLAAGCSNRASAGAEGGFSVLHLTNAHDDHYVLTARDGQLTFQAPKTNKSIGTRQAFWPSGQGRSVDGEACVTWSLQNGTVDPAGISQEGVVLRVATKGGRTRAVSVTKNIFEGYIWIFNIHVWDTANERHPYKEIGAKNLADMVWTPKAVNPLPWNLCARTRGRTLSFVVWSGSGPKPSYTDPKASRAITLPRDYVYAGNFGGYLGHLHPGDSVTFSSLSTSP
jgi:hypothetical protein